jgi:MFS family permease
MRAAFRQPGFRLLFCGLLASMAGDSIMILVLAIWVKDLTDSSAAAGLTLFFLVIPTLIGPFLGVWIDRLKRRTVLIWGNFASAVAVMPLFMVEDEQDVWVIYSVAVLYGISFVLLPAALNGLLKEMLPDELLVDANAALSTSKEALRLVGPLIGAGLYTALGGASVAVVDALSFSIAGVVVAVLAVREDKPERHEGHLRDEFLAGIRHIRHDAVLLHTMIGIGVALLVVGFMESAVFAMMDAFDKPASFVGVIVSVQGVGAIAGGITSASVIRRMGEVHGIGLSLILLAVGLAIAAAAPTLAIVFVGVVVLGYALPVFVVAFTTLLQRRTPGRLMGRVSTATDVVLGTPQSFSIALGAVLVTTLSYRSIYWISAVVLVISAVYLRVALGARPTVEAVSESSGGMGAEFGEDLPHVETSSLDGQRHE